HEAVRIPAYHGVDEFLQPAQRVRPPDHRSGEPLAIDFPAGCGSGKESLDRRHRLAVIEPMYGGIGIVHGNALFGEHACRRGLSHADRACEPEDDHATASRSATTISRRAGVTSGRTPNQRSKPGTA